MGISVLPMMVADLVARRLRLPAHIKFVITNHFHHADLLPLRSQRDLRIFAVPIEVSLLLRKQVDLLTGPIVFLETERQMAQDITDDVRGIMSELPVSTVTVDDIAVSLQEILGKAPSHQAPTTTVFLSPRDRGSLDEAWRNHPNVKVVSFSICETAWGSIGEFIGMPIGPLG
jgi:hypothetical protein